MYEGQYVRVMDTISDEMYNGRVAMMEDGVGVSIVDSADDQYVLCIRGPKSPYFKEQSAFTDIPIETRIKYGEEAYQYVKEMIENDDIIYIDKIHSIIEKHVSGEIAVPYASAESCPFNE